MATDRHRVAWYEGMALDPHHLQQHERHARARLAARLRGVSRTAWGLHELTVDEDRLAGGEFALVRCAGILPDGEPFSVPEADPLPPARAVRDAFEPTQERLDVFLALPSAQAGRASVGTAGAGEPRYATETIRVADENTGADERSVDVARPNLSLRLGGEPSGAYVQLQVARLMRTPDGAIGLDPAFVPTCTTIAASRHLTSLARRLSAQLAAKSEQFAARRDGVFAQRELTPRDLAAVGLLGVVSAHLPLLTHHLAGGSHPRALFETLLGLMGGLSAYLPQAGVRPVDAPVYVHEAPTDCFATLAGQIDRMLGGAAPRTGSTHLPFERVGERIYHAHLGEGAADARLFLAARSDALAEHRLASELPRLVRVATPETIDAVLQSYTRALPVEHTNRLPAGVPVDERASYFELRRVGPFWEAIAQGGALALFVPSELEDLEVELVAVGA